LGGDGGVPHADVAGFGGEAEQDGDDHRHHGGAPRQRPTVVVVHPRADACLWRCIVTRVSERTFHRILTGGTGSEITLIGARVLIREDHPPARIERGT
jgi:hypothetical protein